jgi:hypothetical protein
VAGLLFSDLGAVGFDVGWESGLEFSRHFLFCKISRMTYGTEELLISYDRGRLGDFDTEKNEFL